MLQPSRPRRRGQFLADIETIYRAAAASADPDRCCVAPSPDLQKKIDAEMAKIRKSAPDVLRPMLRASVQPRVGFNDGLIVPGDKLPLGSPPSVARAVALDRAPLRGDVRVIVVLVDFSDRAMAQTRQHFEQLFFSTGVIPTGSVREYYQEATGGLVNIVGEVVGPFRMPRTMAAYANGASGTGGAAPNARTLARDAAQAANPTVNYAPYDNDGNGYVDAFIVVHAGPGAEVTGNTGHIWSHKWVLPAEYAADGAKIFAYLTVPEDCKIGVCAHELGHLLFGFPDLYDTDSSSSGIGNFCLMAGGSWNGGGDVPAHPSAWCKCQQGWVSILNQTANANVSIQDVKAGRQVYRLWKDGAPGSEYFLVENRQKTGYDRHLPGAGLLIWHVDDTISGNTNEAHPKVALMQADGLRQLEAGTGRGDAGDPFPGAAVNRTFNATSNPSSKSYGNVDTCVAVTAIGDPGPSMTARLQVRCGKIAKEVIKDKEFAKERKELHKIEAKEAGKDRMKDFKEGAKERKEKDLARDKTVVSDKNIVSDKRPEKPVTDKSAGLDKGFGDVRPGGFGGAQGDLAARIAALEQAVANLQPFIPAELRPDLAGGAYLGEDDVDEMGARMAEGEAAAKRQMDTKLPDR